MIFLSILILIVALALPSINQNIRSILYVRISSIIFIYAGALALNAFYIQSIGSGIGVYSGLFQVMSIFLDYFNQFDVSGTQFIILKKVVLSLIWFVIGVYSYMKLVPFHLKQKIDKLTLLELIVVLYTIFFSLKLIGVLIQSYFLTLQLPDLVLYCSLAGDSSTGSRTHSGNIIDKAGDTAIMTTSVAVAAKCAQKSPNVAVKAAFLARGVASSLWTGGAAIVVKNVAGQVSLSSNQNHFIFDPTQIYNSIFNLTGNAGVDLLNLIQVFQMLELLFLFLIGYNFIVLYINESLVESFLIKILPTKLVHIFMKSLKLLKRSALLLIICSFILLLVSNLYSYYYLQFFIDNLDHIIDFYLKK